MRPKNKYFALVWPQIYGGEFVAKIKRVFLKSYSIKFILMQ